MYKIYINDSVLILGNTSSLLNVCDNYDAFEVLKYQNDTQFSELIPELEAAPIREVIVFLSEDLEKMMEDLQLYYRVHLAGGGVVVNPKGEILMIFRRGKWDLAKGHWEEGETIEQTALREVEEETGVTPLKLGRPIKINHIQKNTTYHTYFDKKERRVLKQTLWFEMFCPDGVTLVPQIEEDIERLEWVNLNDLGNIETGLKKSPHLINTFDSIRDVVVAYMGLR